LTGRRQRAHGFRWNGSSASFEYHLRDRWAGEATHCLASHRPLRIQPRLARVIRARAARGAAMQTIPPAKARRVLRTVLATAEAHQRVTASQTEQHPRVAEGVGLHPAEVEELSDTLVIRAEQFCVHPG
jgi:hypothetical protein